MTTPEERWQEFLDECVNIDHKHPGATRTDGAPTWLVSTAHLSDKPAKFR